MRSHAALCQRISGTLQRVLQQQDSFIAARLYNLSVDQQVTSAASPSACHTSFSPARE
jgi:hypothetical protein